MNTADSVVEAVRVFHEQHHGRGGGPFSRPMPITLAECNDPRCLALADLNSGQHDPEAHYVQDPDNFVLSEGCPACIAIAARKET